MLLREQLRPYQDRAVEFIKTHDNCALWLDCGLGKSVSTLTAFYDLLHDFLIRRMLIIAPLRVARQVWHKEIEEWAHLKGLTVSRIVGTAEQRMQALRTPADIHTVNVENCHWLYAQFVQDEQQIVRWPWELVVLDESSLFKSQSSGRWKCVAKLRKLFPRLVELTGTPIPNGYEDLWSQAFLLDGGARLGASESDFKQRWFDPPYGEYGKWTLKENAATEIKELMADLVLSLREEDYLTLPPVMFNFIPVQLSREEMKTYKQMEKKLMTSVKGKTLTAVNLGVLEGKLLQLANGAVYTDDKNKKEWVEFHRQKLEALKELIDTIPGKLLIVYHFKHDLERIRALLGGAGRTWALLRSDKDFGRWAAGELEIGLLHPASAGHGLNDVYKSGAEDIIHFGLNASLELYQQVNARLTGGHRRAGRNIRVHHIIAEGTRDEDYVELIQDKAATQDDLTRSLASRSQSLQLAA